MTDTQQPPSPPQPPPWNGQPWGTHRPPEPPQPTPPASNNAATVGFVLGIVALLIGIVAGGALSMLLALVGLVVSGIGIAAAKRALTGRGLAITGVVLALIALASSAGHRSTATTSSTSASPYSYGSSASAPTTSEAPTRTPIATQNFSGKGDDVIDLSKSSGIALVTFSCPKCTSNTVVKTDGPDSLLVNEIGAYQGTRWIDERDNSLTSRITVKADSSWTLSVHDLNDATHSAGPVSGHGDDVVVLQGSSTKARITNARGESNFVVKTISSSGDLDLAVNEIGGYSGVVPLDGPAIVEVQSDGDWTLTPQ